MPAWERRYRDRCESYEGDPNAWRAQAPAHADGLALMEQFSACSWVVSQGPDGAISAKLYIRARTDIQLPFEPSVSPRWEIARCSGDRSEANEPKLEVSALLQTQDGFLVGYDSGEFGGGLSWFNAEGQFQESFTNENTWRIVPTSTGAVVFTGLSHVFSNKGQVLRLRHRAGRWQVARTNLPGAPLAVFPDANESFLVATTRHLLRIQRDLRVTVLHRGAWGGNGSLNSMARDASGTIYLGMGYVVARLRPTRTGYVEEWLAPVGPQLLR